MQGRFKIDRAAISGSQRGIRLHRPLQCQKVGAQDRSGKELVDQILMNHITHVDSGFGALAALACEAMFFEMQSRSFTFSRASCL